MERTVYLNSRFCAVAEDGRLTEYIPVTPEDRTGRILWGKVDRIMPGLDAAFVKIGGTRDGFLPLKENSGTFQGLSLRSGDRVLVQVRREENGAKGAYLSRDLSLPGSRLILMPLNRHVGVSARVKEPEVRERLLELGRKLSEKRFGLVLREASLSASEDELRKDLSELLDLWKDIQEGRFPAFGPEDELLRDYEPRGITRVIRNGELSADLDRQRKETANRTVRLPHGGNIIIDRCEALTVIDVNSASDSGEGSRRETVLRTNLEACREIMIQTRLRNLSGILILDFIDMSEENDRLLVLQTLGDAFRQDRVKTVIHGYTSLGLVEMTRKRSRPAWQEQQST